MIKAYITKKKKKKILAEKMKQNNLGKVNTIE